MEVLMLLLAEINLTLKDLISVFLHSCIFAIGSQQSNAPKSFK